MTMEELITINQLKDILQVDRLTVYRMLKDGRIRGVKVGRQWRVPRSEVTELVKGLPGLGPEIELRPSEILPVHCLQVIQDVFAEMVGVGSLTTDDSGEPLTFVSNPCEFCSLILEQPSGRAACVASWRKLARSQTDEPELTTCHAGLQYARAPIEQNGRRVGIQFAGQFNFGEPDETEEGHRVAELADAHGIDQEKLSRAAKSIHRLQPSDRARVGRWLARVAETFEIIAVERADLIGRLESIANLSNFEN